MCLMQIMKVTVVGLFQNISDSFTCAGVMFLYHKVVVSLKVLEV